KQQTKSFTVASSLSIYINIFFLAFLLTFAVFTGYMVRRAQQKKLRKRVLELEQEMVISHSEILGLQQNIAELRREKKPAATVVAMPEGNKHYPYNSK